MRRTLLFASIFMTTIFSACLNAIQLKNETAERIGAALWAVLPAEGAEVRFKFIEPDKTVQIDPMPAGSRFIPQQLDINYAGQTHTFQASSVRQDLFSAKNSFVVRVNAQGRLELSEWVGPWYWGAWKGLGPDFVKEIIRPVAPVIRERGLEESFELLKPTARELVAAKLVVAARERFGAGAEQYVDILWLGRVPEDHTTQDAFKRFIKNEELIDLLGGGEAVGLPAARSRFRTLILLWHPDKHPESRVFATEITQILNRKKDEKPLTD